MPGKHFDLDTDILLGGTNSSDIIIPSQKAIKTYVDNTAGGGVKPEDIPTKTSDLINDSGFIDEDTLDTELAKKANVSHTHTKSDITDLVIPTKTSQLVNDSGFINDISGKQDKIDATHKLSADLVADGTTNKVVTATEKATWNGKQDVISDIADIRTNATAGAGAATTIAGYGDIVTHDADEFQPAGSYVPTTRTVNGKALSANITLNASDVSALPASTVIPTITDTYSATSSDGMSGKAVASAISTKQNTISDLADIRSGAAAGATALQPGDNISELTNDAGFITKTVADLTNYTTTTDLNTALGNKVTKNADITAGTKCKITYDAKGLVTGGANLAASDIPNLTLTKITDVTATKDEVNVLDGITASTTELNYVQGVTSAIQDQLDAKLSSIPQATASALGGIKAAAKTAAETQEVKIDTTTGKLYVQPGGVASVAFADITGEPTDNTKLSTALDAKVTGNAAITGATKCKITYDSKGLVTAGANLTASDIPNLTLNKITDVTATAAEVNILDGATLTTTELNYVDGVTSNIQTQLNGKIASTEKGVANGVATLDNNGTVPLSQINDALLGNVKYMGLWDASGGTAPSSSPTKGNYWITSVAGTFDSKSYQVGDWIICNADTPTVVWDKVNNTDAVSSVQGRTGNVTIISDSSTATDYTWSASKLNTQLTGKVDKNADITGATKCKITYDSKGLVTAGANLTASDIPSLSLSKISDVTATAAELNVLDGITATTTELNYTDGVTSNIQTQLNGKLTGNAAITGATKAKITYDSKGLVTGGADLTDADIPDLSLAKITDVSASADEVNVLDGITATTAELNYCDGVTSNIQTQLNGKLTGNTAITGATKCKITYDAKGLVTAGADLASADITTALGYTPYNSTNPAGYVTTDTKNTAGSTDTSSKIYLVGAVSQAANPQTFSHDTAFVDVDGAVNSVTPGASDSSTKVATTAWVAGKGYLTGLTQGAGITVSGNTITNAGVRAVASGTANGTISVNTNGTSADVAVKGLGSAAYTASTDYAAASHNQAANTITALTGYTKATASSAIATTDSLNAALGKLEYKVDNGGITKVTVGMLAG